MYLKIIKPIIDFLLGITGFILFSPMFFIIFIILMFNNNGSSFFFQERPGKNKKIFKVIKFKTMNDKKDKYGNLLSDSKRLTIMGRIIRKTSLDELPQLINVIKGDMSIVGPRPLLPEYLDIYNQEQSQRHNVKPGITGWAQVNGRNAISWTKKLEYDVWYVKNLSLILDVKIILKTIIKVIKSEGINAENAVTTEKFTGYN